MRRSSVFSASVLASWIVCGEIAASYPTSDSRTGERATGEFSSSSFRLTSDGKSPSSEGRIQELRRACNARGLFRRWVRVVVTQAEVFIQPGGFPVPLTTLTQGSVIRVVEPQGEWLLIRFEDARWGTRVGYLHCSSVVVLDEPSVSGVPAAGGQTQEVQRQPSAPNTPTPSAWVPPTTAVARGRVPQSKPENLSGYVEWIRDGYIVADGQRVHWNAQTRLRLGRFRDIASVPLGSEISARGPRLEDGSILAQQLEFKPNGRAMYEREAVSMGDALENLSLSRGSFQAVDEHGELRPVGPIISSGMAVERLRRIMARLLPAYVAPQDIRLYIVQTPDWNARVSANGAVWVYSGLLDDVTSDDELAVVLGHELAHYTHEHMRRSLKQAVWRQLAILGAQVAIDRIESPGGQRVAVELAKLGFQAWTNGYSRSLEDQADRVGLRYLHEAGYDVEAAPAIWHRVLARHGELHRLGNFFFGSHPRPSDRIRNIEQQLQFNYRESPPADGIRR